MLCIAIFTFRNVAQFYDDHIKRKDYDYSQLPQHVTAQILSHLGIADLRNASMACKSWYYASSDPRVTKEIRVNIYKNLNSRDYLVRPIHNLMLDHYLWNKKCLKVIQCIGTSVTNFEISSKITMKQLFEIFIYLPNVRSVKIDDYSTFVSIGNFERSKTIIKHKAVIMRHLSQLKKISISTAVRNLKMYQLFLSYCPNIEELRVHWESSENEEGEFLFNYLLDPIENSALYKLVELNLENIDRQQNSKFFEKMVQLELLNVKRLSLKEISTTYYDVMFKQFCKTYRHLDSFSITGCNDQHLIDICAYMTNLKTLEINNCIANNLSQILSLKHLEALKIERIDVIVNDELIVLLSKEHNLLKKLNLSEIDYNILKLISENCKNLENLYISNLKTTECEPIFRHLIKLKKLTLVFTDNPTKNSSRFRSSDRYNISNLIQLEDLYVNRYVPGITPEYIGKLPKLKKRWDDIWDPPYEQQVITDWIDDDNFDQNHVIVNNDDDDDVVENVNNEEEKIVIYDISDFIWCQELISE